MLVSDNANADVLYDDVKQPGLMHKLVSSILMLQLVEEELILHTLYTVTIIVG